LENLLFIYFYTRELDVLPDLFATTNLTSITSRADITRLVQTDERA
jgi:hypothetical protein